MIAMVVEIEGVTTPHPLLTPIIEEGLGGQEFLDFWSRNWSACTVQSKMYLYKRNKIIIKFFKMYFYIFV